ncbi:uncharacterized protein LOC9647494 isoform X1 [Selaginella moellendorffii]|uniref:uncharacterized protein LOC9647494 isoform X1 n=1 Tax=Selaginella moellendorffii TaxID=88036 RepID=UPI000D1C3962|nr:uncharacterized protein LOC9647494 isoform X1 [Selaginella moellendorffii]|eukprot:XP_024541086.1 uncharacterized protein LOC9647494 isoform X1 [Selaginella moellendorffii]
MECTFKPRINEILRTDRDNREDKLQQQQLGSRFDQLFWDAEIRRRRQAEYTQWYPEGVTFRPSISKSQRSHPDTHEREPGRSVFDRLLEYAERTNLLKQKLLDEFSKPIDPSTGQELFTPITGRKPQVERNASFLPIGEFLYQMYFDLDHKKQAKFEKSLQQTKIKTLEYVLPRSIDILKELEKRSFRQIFDYLDTNKSGIVNLETVVTEALMDDVIEDIEDMKKSGSPVTSLNYEGFVQMLMPIRKAKRRGVHLVLKTRRIDDPFKTFTFRFRMSPYSRALAIKRRKYKGTTNWYKILCQEKGRRATRMEDLQKDLQQVAMRECTFKPVIHSKRGKSIVKMRITGGGGDVDKEEEQQEVHGFIFKENAFIPGRFVS